MNRCSYHYATSLHFNYQKQKKDLVYLISCKKVGYLKCSFHSLYLKFALRQPQSLVDYTNKNYNCMNIAQLFQSSPLCPPSIFILSWMTRQIKFHIFIFLSGRQAVFVLNSTTCSFSGHKKWQKIGNHFVFLFTSRQNTDA